MFTGGTGFCPIATWTDKCRYMHAPMRFPWPRVRHWCILPILFLGELHVLLGSGRGLSAAYRTWPAQSGSDEAGYSLQPDSLDNLGRVGTPLASKSI